MNKYTNTFNRITKINAKALSIYLSDEAVKKGTAAAKKQKRSLSFIIDQLLLTLKVK